MKKVMNKMLSFAFIIFLSAQYVVMYRLGYDMHTWQYWSIGTCSLFLYWIGYFKGIKEEA